MKREYEIEQLILNSDGGLTHRELARKLGAPEPSVRRTLQVLRDGKPRFKAGYGMFDIVAVGERRFGNETSKQTVWGVQWRSLQDVRFEKNYPGDFDSGSVKVS